MTFYPLKTQKTPFFNMKDEPIVCSPLDAVRAFERSKLDFLVMGPYLAWKSENNREEDPVAN